MTLNIYPVFYSGPGVEGDLGWMIRSGNYPNSIFVFPEVLDYYNKFNTGPQEQQNARPYNLWGLYGQQQTPLSQGIPQTSEGLGAYPSLTSPGVQSTLDLAFMHLGWVITNSSPSNLYFSAATGTTRPVFDSVGLTGLGSDVTEFITNSIYALGTYTGM